MRRETLGELTVTLTGGEDRQGGGNGPLVVLMHGFGAPGTDLVPLWRQLDVPRKVRFAFPEAPLQLDRELGSPAYAGARAWWMLDLAALERAAMGDELPDRSAEVPAGLGEARHLVLGMLDDLEARIGVPEGQLILGGFSQGAMLALDTALRTSRALAGLVLMSGTLIAQHEWAPLMSNRRGLAVLQSHGRSDPLLPFAAAQRLRSLLGEAGLRVEWVELNGGHTITETVTAALGAFITAQLGG